MSLQLTAPFATDQLPKVAPDPVTITVARTVRPERLDEFLEWQVELVRVVTDQHGCLGATVLHPGTPGGPYQTVFRFVDGLSLRAWERSSERAELLERATPYVIEERIRRAVGVESWFRAAPEITRPWWKTLFVEIGWSFPLSLVISLFVAPGLMALPTVVRVLTTSVFFYLVAKVTIGPLRRFVRGRRTLT